jgi:hypothetical protein
VDLPPDTRTVAGTPPAIRVATTTTRNFVDRAVHTPSPVLVLIVARVLWTARLPARPLDAAQEQRQLLDWWDDFDAAQDAREALVILVDNSVGVLRRAAPLIAAMHAAAGDPDAAAVRSLTGGSGPGTTAAEHGHPHRIHLRRPDMRPHTPTAGRTGCANRLLSGSEAGDRAVRACRRPLIDVEYVIGRGRDAHREHSELDKVDPRAQNQHYCPHIPIRG